MFNLSLSKPDLIVHSQDPLNAEPQLGRLGAGFITAQRDFYVRSHGNIPHLNAATHHLRVEGRVRTPLDLSMVALRGGFVQRTVTATLQCAGNRRGDMLQVRPVSGDPWAPGAIGNAEWTGVALADVLRAAGVDETPGLHVAFTACDDCDVDGEQFRYGASIPIAKAMSPEVLLVHSMNGEALAPEHGFPLRVVTPGFAGARSPKWLATITVQAVPSDAKPQARDYKLFPSDVTKDTADWDKGITIYEMPLNSAICEPAAHAELKAGEVVLRGYAVVGDRAITRVDVSADGGRSWMQAELEAGRNTPWSWTLWQARFDLPKGEHELAVRAWDSAGQTQPALPDDIWNFKGYLCASWHRVRVRVS